MYLLFIYHSIFLQMHSSVFRNHIQIAFRTSSCQGEGRTTFASIFLPTFFKYSEHWTAVFYQDSNLESTDWIKRISEFKWKKKYLSHETSLIRSYHFLLVWAQPRDTWMLKAFLTVCCSELSHIFSNHINILNVFWNMFIIIFKLLILY